MRDLRKIVAHALRVMRADKQMSQQDLADASGVGVDAIGKYERGESMPLLETSCKLASALGCTPNDLCEFPIPDRRG